MANDGNINLVLKANDGTQEYAQVIRMVGDTRYEVYCMDYKVKRRCFRNNKLHKQQVSIAPGDILLVRLLGREAWNHHMDKKCDIILKYTPEQARLLKAYREISEDIRINQD